MTSDDIKALRKELRCTMRELAGALDVAPALVVAWENEEQFPTKRLIKAMDRLRREGPTAVPRARRKRKRLPAASPWALLAEPELWNVFRKLLAHDELRRRVVELAEQYDDPGEDSAR
ncbi:MAG: helix-turn-helix transcriptional regulator [Myxococcota bacterium]